VKVVDPNAPEGFRWEKPGGFWRDAAGDARFLVDGHEINVRGPIAASQIGDKRVEYHPPYHEAVLGVARSLLEGERSVTSVESVVDIARDVVDRVLALEMPALPAPRTQESTR
jgi:hypothetical protein